MSFGRSKDHLWSNYRGIRRKYPPPMVKRDLPDRIVNAVNTTHGEETSEADFYVYPEVWCSKSHFRKKRRQYPPSLRELDFLVGGICGEYHDKFGAC